MLSIKVTLRVFSQTYSLAQISRVLGQAGKGFSVGDVYGKSNRQRDMTLWSMETTLSGDSSLELHLNEVISFLEEKSEGLEMLSEKCSLDVFCMLRTVNGQGGAVLPCTTMEILSRRRVAVVLDIYADE